jgi:CRISPR type III-B/RAMP module-associated protein Cmr5
MTMPLSDQYHLRDKAIEPSPIRSVDDAKRVYACINDAKRAYECMAVAKESEGKKEDFAMLCYKLPLLLRRNGLLKTLEWMRCKHQAEHDKGNQDNEYQRMLAYLFWCLGELMVEKYPDKSSYDNSGQWPNLLIEAAKNSTLSEYMIYTNRCFEVSEWFRSLAQTELKLVPHTP